MISRKFMLFFALLLTYTFGNAQEPNPTPTPPITRTVSLSTSVAYLDIEGMACQEGCADTIAKNLEELEGVQSAKVSYDDGKAIIKFDEQQTTIDDIEKIITDTKVKDYVYTIKNRVIKDNIVR